MGKIVRACDHEVVVVDLDMKRTLAARWWPLLGVCMIVLIVVGLVWAGTRHSGPRPHGNPDPGHHLIDALKPVLGAVPREVKVTQTDIVPPRWDSCDGLKSTYGWDPATVDASFTTRDSQADVVSLVTQRLAKLGWSVATEGDPGDTIRYWQRVLPGGAVAIARLFPPSNGTWSLDAQVPPAVFPSHGC